MKDSSQKWEEEILGAWSDAKPLPDRIYFYKVLRRNFWLIFCGGILVSALAFILSFFVDNTYRSNVHAIFDHVDVSGSGLGTSPQVRYNTVARLFSARFESQDFLNELAQKIGGKEVLLRESALQSEWNRWLKEKLQLAEKDPELLDDKVSLARVLKKQLDAYPEPESGVLTLTAYSYSPVVAQNLANEAMELFIRKELDEQIRSLDIKLSFLQKNIVVASSPNNRKSVDSKDNRVSRAEKLQLEDQVNELEDRLRNLNNQVDANKVDRDQALTSIKRELVRLQTTLQPNHPQVLEKRKEIDVVTAQYSNQESKLISQLDQVRSQLRTLRSSQPLNPDVTNLDIRDAQNYQGSFFVAVSDRIKDIELERKNLIRQKDDPNLRTRIRTIYSAGFDPIPFKNNRRNFGLAVLALGWGLIVFLMFYREISNPKARDVWRIERSSGQKILTQISLKSAQEFADVTPKLADQLRTHLSKVQKVDDAARTLLSYRRLELTMEQGCLGRVLFFVNAGPSDQSAQVIKNFLNIYATDQQEPFLLIDCNLQDPVLRKPQEGADLIDFIEGKASFEQVAIKAHLNEGLAFDLIPPMLKMSGERTRSFREEQILRAIQSIPPGYSKIFIRAMPESHFIENVALLSASTDGFVFVDAEQTSYFDLTRSLTHLKSEKLRGLVAIGT